MKRSFKEALQNRRTCYAINDRSSVPDAEIREIVDFALLHVPSAFNSQSTRLVLLLKAQHKKLWGIVMDSLRAVVPPENFAQTEEKINSFAAGYGTVLFFEDPKVVEDLQGRFPTYADRFPVWSQHTSAMHQLAIWTMLEDVGMGASLQHYNPLIDDKVKAAWGLNPKWTLVAQMPFGGLAQAPDPKEYLPLDERRKVFE